MSHPNLVTDRMLLRPFTLTDASAHYTLNADPEVMRYVPDAPFSDITAAQQFLEDYLPIYELGFGRLAMIDKVSGAFIGWCGLKLSPELAQVDLGYRLNRQYWGQGYATEASLACLDYGFRMKKLNRIVGLAMATNLASRRVLEKVGMELVGTFKEPDWSGVLYEIRKHP